MAFFDYIAFKVFIFITVEINAAVFDTFCVLNIIFADFLNKVVHFALRKSAHSLQIFYMERNIYRIYFKLICKIYNFAVIFGIVFTLKFYDGSHIVLFANIKIFFKRADF